MSKIIVENELMKNQKAAELLPAQSSFKSIQSYSGSSILLSVNDSKALNLIVEESGNTTGWQFTDITSELSPLHGGKKIVVQNYAVTQSAGNGDITIAVTIKAEGDDSCHLYLLPGLSNASEADWKFYAGHRKWVARPFDDITSNNDNKALNISGIFLLPDQVTTKDQQLICEVVNDNGYLQNYTVNFSGDNAWKKLQTAENFNIVLSQQTGKPKASQFAGIYQLTNLDGGLTIVFVPMKSMFGPPSIIKLKAPDGARKLVTLPTDDNNTNLYVAANESIYLFTSENQVNFAEGTKIISNSLITGIQDFHAHQSKLETILWGLNQTGEVFCARCEKGSELDPDAWSVPVPILTEVDQIASYIDQQTENRVIFAHTSGQNLVKLTQSPETTHWLENNILLPTIDVNKVVEYNTYTTHVQLLDDDNIPTGNAGIFVTATHDCNAYINNVYHVLSPNNRVKVSPDAMGQISIVQETRTLGAVCYHLETEDKSVRIDVNPMAKLIDKIAAVKSGLDLKNIQVPKDDESEGKEFLLKDATQDKLDSTALSLQNFAQIAKNMPQDGSVKTRDTKASLQMYSAKSFVATDETIWGMSFEEGNWQCHSGLTAISHFGLRINDHLDTFAIDTDTIQLSSIWDAIESVAGDIWHWLKHAFDKAKSFFIKVVNDVYHFFINIAGKLYRFVLNCVRDILHAVEFVFNKIKVFIEDLIKWLGFLFQWKDIIRTHNVLKNTIKVYLRWSIDQGGKAKKDIANIFDNIGTHLKEWAGLEPLEDNWHGKFAGPIPDKGQNSPEGNYGFTHLKNGFKSASVSFVDASNLEDRLTDLLKELKQATKNQEEIFEDAFKTLEKQVIGQIRTLSIGEIIIRLLAVLGDIITKSVESIINTAIDVVIIIVEGMFNVLDAPIEIPVLSWLYNKITNGSSLSLLDLVCLVLAIPATIVYKIIKNKAPFPNNETTKDLISADTLEKFRNALDEKSSAKSNLSLEMNLTTGDDVWKSDFLKLFRLVACFSSLGYIWTSTEKAKLDEPGRAVNLLHFMFFFFATAPDFASGLVASTQQRWDKIAGEAIYGVSLTEKFASSFISRLGWTPVSKKLDFILGLLAMVPTIAAPVYKKDAQTITDCISTSCWNLNRVCTPWTSIENIYVYGTKMGLIALFGVTQFIVMLEECFDPTTLTREKLAYSK